MTSWSEEDLYAVAQLGYEFAMQGRYREAAVFFEGLLAVCPDYAYARRAWAAVMLRLGNMTQALAILDAGSAKREIAARRLRLEALLELGWHKEAGDEYAAVCPRLEPADARRFAMLLENRQLGQPASDN